MITVLEDFCLYVYVIVDDLYQQLRPLLSHPGPAPRCSDSELLAQWHVGYLPTSREFAMQNGMAQRQWQNAMALLKLGRICDQAGRWRVHDLPTISAKLGVV